MKLKYSCATALVVCAFLTACAQPESVSEIYDQTVGTGNVNINDGNDAPVFETQDVSQDNGRKITATYGSGEYVLNIDAEVSIPKARPQSGKLVTESIDKKLVEQYLCDGEELYKSDSTDANVSVQYVFAANETATDLPYDISYCESGDGTASFTNWRLDSYFSGYEVKQILPENRTGEQQEYVQSMEEKAQNLADSLLLDAKTSHSWLSVGDSQKFCAVFLNMRINGFSMVSKDYYSYIQSNVMISEHGVNSFNFAGLYQAESTENTSVLSLDQILELVETGVENKNINSCSVPVELIELAYMVESTEEGIRFFPVWCFSGQLGSDTGLMPLLCIHAMSGEIEFMASY